MKIKGENIRVFREGLGMTVAQFAKHCGVRRQAVEAWEDGQVKKFSTLTKIAQKLGVQEKALLEV